MKAFIIFSGLMFCLSLKSQTKAFEQTPSNFTITKDHEATFDLGAFYTPLISTNAYGLNTDLKFYPYKRFATGFCASITNKKINKTFQYTIGQPVLSYYEFGWINQYDILQKDRIRIGLNVNNCIAFSQLGDNNIKEKYYAKYGVQEKAKTISNNYFYLLEPGLDMNIRLFSNKHDPDFYLTLKAKYRFVFGDTQYGQHSDFSNYYLGLGFSMIGLCSKK